MTTVDDQTSRTLVLCFDGTGDMFDNDPTNIVHLFSLLDKSNPHKQLVYYQPGLGTYVSPGTWSSIFRNIAKAADKAVAWYLDAHIMGGYNFLMENWRPGDKICLFGFSRGAYTARCLAGMLHKVGLVSKSNVEQVPFAYTLYKDRTAQGIKNSFGFKETFCRVVDIEFVGCWDTVSSVGFLYSRHLPFTSSNKIVKTFRHALALDERRAKFKANGWHHTAPDSSAAKYDPESGSAVKNQPPPLGGNLLQRAWLQTERAWRETEKSLFHTGTTGAPRVRADTVYSQTGSSVDVQLDADYGRAEKTNVLEVWFAGCHADVGGGSTNDNVTHSLANPSLRWMIKETITQQAGIMYKEDALFSFGVDSATGQSSLRRLAGLAPPSTSTALRRDPETGARVQPTSDATVVDISTDMDAPEQEAPPKKSSVFGFRQQSAKSAEEGNGGSATLSNPTTLALMRDPEYRDATSKIYDQLRLSPAWWILELIPIRQSYQDSTGHWHRKWAPNMFGPRVIHNKGHPLYFHSTVKLRMETMGYKPKALYTGQPMFVD